MHPGLERRLEIGGGAHGDHVRVLGDGAIELADAQHRLAQRQLGQVDVIREERADLDLHPARLQLRQPARRERPLFGAEVHELHEQIAVRVRETHRRHARDCAG